jgi:hypothetical protein
MKYILPFIALMAITPAHAAKPYDPDAITKLIDTANKLLEKQPPAPACDEQDERDMAKLNEQFKKVADEVNKLAVKLGHPQDVQEYQPETCAEFMQGIYDKIWEDLKGLRP